MELTGLALTADVTLAVLGAALLHAAWNAIIKSGRDPLLDTALIALSGSAVALPLIFVVAAPATAAWPYIAVSVTVHLGYYTALAAAYKAGERAQDAVCASDAFFPFRDGIDQIHTAGIKAVIQPGGSKRDDEVIATCDEYGIAMIFTGRRHFRH